MPTAQAVPDAGHPPPPTPAPHDAGIDTGYRDPRAGDGACAAPNLVCGAACIAVTTDVGHCGSCGNACTGTDPICIGGQCACASVGYDYCQGVGCMDVSSDLNNCGACGNVCDPNQFTACENGTCIP